MTPDLPWAHADATRVRQILIILVDNAIKFTPEGGAVTVQARRLDADPRFLSLEVSDTGCGIDPAMIGTIFERLRQVPTPTRASRNGLGLGLYISKELVTCLGGQMSVRSELHKGSAFRFTLPVTPANQVTVPFPVPEAVEVPEGCARSHRTAAGP